VISPLRATGIVAVGTAVSLAVSVITSKALAVLTGTEGIGLYGLMQSTLTLATIVFGLGISTSLVRAIAESGGADKEGQTDLLRAAAWLVTAVAALAMVLIALLFGGDLAGALFADRSLGWAIPLIAFAAALTLVGGIEVAALNGFHLISTITRISVASSVIGGIGLIGFVAAAGADGIAPGLLTTASVGCAVAIGIGSRVLGRPKFFAPRAMVSPIRGMLAVGAPYTASQLAGTGAQLLLPIVVLYQLDSHAVGLFRAAITISTGYLAFVLTAFAQDYYPRIAAADASQVQDLIERRTRLVMAIAVPIILGTLALAPILVELLYASEFADATDVLQWQLIGDLLKLPAWALAFAILARGAAMTFFIVELVGGVSMVIAVWLATSALGIAGAGIGYLVSYAIYYVAVWLAARTVAPVIPGRLQLVVVALVAALALANVVFGSAPFIRAVLLLIAAAVLAVVAWPRIWRLHSKGEL
jgi:O-antigen/teichoic acid export membrane protein